MKYKIESSLYLEIKDSQHLALNLQWLNDLSVSCDEKGIIGTAVYLKTKGHLREPFTLDELTSLLSRTLPDNFNQLKKVIGFAVQHGYIEEVINGKN